MGACRTRRPFLWQDEMAEVRNLFQRVDKVRRSAFTGFSLWKDEPTAETLSRNRLRRRRSQFALDLTHLNYGESPYEALNHIHNIRGMCARIQRQGHFVERRKKDCDVDLQPALLRRPATSYSWLPKEIASEKSSIKSGRPGSAPVHEQTPLHYTPSKPTILFDATHRCPRYARGQQKSPSIKPLGRSAAPPLKAIPRSNWNEVSSSELSSPIATHPSTRSLSVAAALNSCPGSFQMSADSSLVFRDSGSSYPDVSDAETIMSSVMISSEVETEHSAFASSRPSSSGQVERPPSRKMSKRPSSAGISKSSAAVADKASNRGMQYPPGESPGRGVGAVDPSSSETRPLDGFSHIRPPSRSDADAGLVHQRTKTIAVTPSDGAAGLWALKQEHQRPASARTMREAAQQEEDVRPATSPSRPRTNVIEDLPVHETPSRSPSRSKSRAKALDQVELSDNDNINDRNNLFPGRTDEDDSEPLSSAWNQSDVLRCASDNATPSEPFSAETASADESHVVVKHSTDPYNDFKDSMLRMIHDENLYNKQRELEELFQYYMDLNPAAHHEVLRRVVVDICREVAPGNSRTSNFQIT